MSDEQAPTKDEIAGALAQAIVAVAKRSGETSASGPARDWAEAAERLANALHALYRA